MLEWGRPAGDQRVETLIGILTMLAAVLIAAAPIIAIGYFTWRKKLKQQGRG